MIGINVQGLIDWISKLGVVGILVLVLAGFQQGWWFFGRERDALREQLAAMTKDRDEWKVLALTSMHAGERAAQAATVVMPTLETRAP